MCTPDKFGQFTDENKTGRSRDVVFNKCATRMLNIQKERKKERDRLSKTPQNDNRLLILKDNQNALDMSWQDKSENLVITGKNQCKKRRGKPRDKYLSGLIKCTSKEHHLN